jgi:hypothetical protein
MRSINRVVALSVILALAVIIGVGGFHHPKSVAAQYGSTFVPGFAAPAVTFAALATTTGAAGTVTNPGANLSIQVDGGPVFCSGAEENISESVLNLLANTTYLIVFNCPQTLVYAKTAVTGPGSLGTSQLNGPGVPNAILYPIPGVEIPLATVVCGASTCATITDSRSVAQFPAAKMLAKSTFANLPSTYADGGMLICTSCTVLTTGSATCTSGAGVDLAVRVSGAWRCF